MLSDGAVRDERPRVSFVVLTNNSEGHVERCVSSLLESARPPVFDHVVVVDNGSTDGTVEIVERLAATYPNRIDFIRLDRNLGTTVSRNMALQRIKGRYIGIVDSDTVVAGPVVDDLVAHLEAHPSCGLCAPRLVYPSGTHQLSTDTFPTLWRKLQRYFGLRTIEQRDAMPREACHVDYAISAFWVLRADVVDRVGMFDEAIFYAPEDVDYCIRVWQSGSTVDYLPVGPVVHHAQEISRRGWWPNGAAVAHVKGLLHLFRKHRYAFSSRSLYRRMGHAWIHGRPVGSLLTRAPRASTPVPGARNLVRGATSSWLGYVVNAAVALLLTPYVVGTLGDAAYGVWTLAIGLTGYYGLLDLGFRSGLTQALARAVGMRDQRQLRQVASTGVFLLSGLGLLVGVLAVAVGATAGRLLDLPMGSARDAGFSIAILGIGLGFQFTFFTFSAALVAVQRIEVANAIGVITRLLTAAGSWLVLSTGWGIVGLSVVTLVGNFLDYGLRFVAARRLLPEMTIRPSLVSAAQARTLLSYGSWMALAAAGTRLISYTDALVIASYMPAAAITPFALAAALAAYVSDLVVVAAQVLFPAFAQLDARGDTAGARGLFLKSGMLLSMAGLVVGALSAVWVDEFFSLWVGPSQLEGNAFGSASVIFLLLIIGLAPNGLARVSGQVQLATGAVRRLSMLVAAEAVLNLMLSLLLVRTLGIVGVAMGTLLPALLFGVFVHPAVAARQLDLPVRQVVFGPFKRPLVTAGLVGALGLVLRAAVEPGSWLLLSCTVGVHTILAAVIVVLLWRSELGAFHVRPSRLSDPIERGPGGFAAVRAARRF